MTAQLFIGRLSKSTRQRDIEDMFDYYGKMSRCEVKCGSGMAYAFVDYVDKRDAEDAIKHENGREVNGQNIVVEWARGPKRGFDDECYRCGRRGHFARACRDGGGGGDWGRRRGGGRSYGYSRRRSRSRSRDRYRSRSRSPDRRRRSSPGSRSRSPRKYSRSPSPRRSNGHHRSRSRSPDRGRSP
ncbi:serine/arginine-rich splicing factor RS2Z33-like [Lytechinus variegatus]|uniref:serine/arginine-rich splicing factor RS2Z33-like n=1 Tax=Lytechinus variegatus TaxID=7654 RepID=UPI001BB1013E|nr:serine/arginine-rich splicing factor RS2Z33-like [Lytechinus variegatus]